MDHAFTFASPAGAAVASALFGGIAAGIGVAVTVLLKRLAAPPDEPSYMGTTPRARRAIGLGVALGLLILVWIWLWSGFYHLTIRSGEVELAYLAPPRTRTLPVSEIARVSWIPKPKNQRALVVTTTDGTAYTSANTSLPSEDLALIQKAIEAAGSARLDKTLALRYKNPSSSAPGRSQ